MDWFRWHHGTSKDPKWRVISRRSGVSIVTVVSVWATIAENASESSDRGTLQGWNPEDVAAQYDIEPDQVRAVYDAMQGKVLEGNRLTGWEKRNPKREREGDDSTPRVQRYREKKRLETEGNATKRIDREIDRLEREKEETQASPSGDDVETYSPDFEIFWTAYPRKVGKGAAWKVWHRLRLSRLLQDRILAAVAEARQSSDWTRDGGQYVPHPATWLSQHRWNDTLKRPNQNTNSVRGFL